MKENSFVSVIIPCRNEKDYIKKCLESLLKQDYPKENLEILVVDGMSEDGTKGIVEKYALEHPSLDIRIKDNENKIKSSALNIWIPKSKGDFIAIADAHTEYQKNYISKAVNYLKEYNTDAVGGIIKIPSLQHTKLKARAIAISLSSFFGAASFFRRGTEKPQYVDTVFNGCYKREVFNKIGLFNENLVRSQDLEFNLRLKKAGGKILLVPDIVFIYYPKPNLKDFFAHNLEDGIWAIYPLKFTKTFFRLRHYLPLFFILAALILIIASFFSLIFLYSLATLILLYLLTNILSSILITIKEKDFRYFFLMPFIFAVRHFGYGLGSLWGLIKLAL